MLSQRENLMDKDRLYYDKKFLGSMAGRPIRILSEYLGPLNTLKKYNIEDTIVFFGSARLRPKTEYYDKAKQLSYNLTKWNMSQSTENSNRYILMVTKQCVEQ